VNVVAKISCYFLLNFMSVLMNCALNPLFVDLFLPFDSVMEVFVSEGSEHLYQLNNIIIISFCVHFVDHFGAVLILGTDRSRGLEIWWP